MCEEAEGAGACTGCSLERLWHRGPDHCNGCHGIKTLVLTPKSFAEVVDRIDNPQPPTPELCKLMRGGVLDEC